MKSRVGGSGVSGLGCRGLGLSRVQGFRVVEGLGLSGLRRSGSVLGVWGLSGFPVKGSAESSVGLRVPSYVHSKF